MFARRLARSVGLLLTVLLLVAISVPVLANHGPTAETVVEVDDVFVDEILVDFDFDPSSVTIKAGENLQFDNTSVAPHTLSVALGKTNGGFDSGNVFPGGTVIVTTAHLQPGSYSFFCRVHGAAVMSGTLTVES